MKRGYLDELAEEQDTNATVLGGEEFNVKEEALDSDEGELGGVEAADDHLGSPTIKRWSVQALLQTHVEVVCRLRLVCMLNAYDAKIVLAFNLC